MAYYDFLKKIFKHKESYFWLFSIYYYYYQFLSWLSVLKLNIKQNKLYNIYHINLKKCKKFWTEKLMSMKFYSCFLLKIRLNSKTLFLVLKNINLHVHFRSTDIQKQVTPTMRRWGKLIRPSRRCDSPRWVNDFSILQYRLSFVVSVLFHLDNTQRLRLIKNFESLNFLIFSFVITLTFENYKTHFWTLGVFLVVLTSISFKTHHLFKKKELKFKIFCQKIIS